MKKQAKCWSLWPQNTQLGSPLKPEESIHLPKANPNNTVQSNKKKTKGETKLVKLTCQVNQVIGLTFVSPRPNGVFIFKDPSNCNVLRQKGHFALSFNLESHLQAHVYITSQQI
jgi:hypothetical protein